jgi:DNA-directed RNA polymerase subunit beta'
MYKPNNKHFQQLQIGVASPKQIKNWAERYLPSGDPVGEVTSWETVNYKTLKPEPNGLFCQRIFGPVVDYTCACGKKSNKVETGFCPKCGVERTTSRVRRYRLGYIQLKQPIVHTLYATHKPSPLSLCLGWSNKRIQAVMYATEFCHLPSTFQLFLSQLETKQKWRVEHPNSGTNNLWVKNIVQPKIDQPFYSKNYSKNLATSNWKPFVVYDKPPANLNKKKPRFFNRKLYDVHHCILKPNEEIIKSNYSWKKLQFGLHLYGVAYDMTWRQVEDLQEFLLYTWEQPSSCAYSIPYYCYTGQVQNKSVTNVKLVEQLPFHPQYYPIQTGGLVFQKIFAHFNLLVLQKDLRSQHPRLKNAILLLQEKIELFGPLESVRKDVNRLKQAEKKCLRQMQYFRDFHKTKTEPAWMVLNYLPVLPPGLRPITSIRGELVVSDLNTLYRKILTRNKRVTSSTRFGIYDTALSGSWASWCYNLRQLQEAVDSLLKNGTVESGKTTKSLLDALKGKKGRFRQHLLGKRVDYSGRSVIVVGPMLKIHECGLPKQMAIELFQPFLVQKLRNKGIAFTTTAAKAIITDRNPIIWEILKEIMRNHPVLLNRAPTLHRLGIQAFLPKLVEGKAILLHPLVCPAFNADFDGDQMAVHVPLSPLAKAESLALLWARNHLLAPSSGQPLLLPSQDMVLGCYYLTTTTDSSTPQRIKSIKTCYFSEFQEVKQQYERKQLSIHCSVWVRCNTTIQNLIPESISRVRELPLECCIDIFGNNQFIFSDRCINYSNFGQMTCFQTTNSTSYIRTTPGRIVFHDVLSLIS